MVENKSSLNEDEFQFSEADFENSSPYEEAAEKGEIGVGRKINRRNILIAIGIIIIAFSIYTFMNRYLARQPLPALVTEQTSQPSIAEQADIVPKVETPAPKEDKIPNLQKQLQNMRTQDQQHNQGLAAINKDLSGLSNSVQNLQNSLADINQQLKEMTSQLKSQQSIINVLKPKKASTRRISQSPSPRGRPVIQRAQWSVQAIIPGRAWLVQPNGSTITVKTGDSLAGYGKIANISVVTGLVRTSSGSVLRMRGS